MRLLLAEDEHSLSKALVAILEGNCYAVDAVYNGEDALAYLDMGSYAGSVWNTAKTKGFLDGYRYLRSDAQDQDGELLIFLDREQKLLSFQNFLLTSLVTSLAGLSAVWVLLMLLAKEIVRPISESYEMQKRFITDAGHELKTPLTIISADTDVLEMQQGRNEWLSDIRVQTERLSKLTHDLIFLAKMEEGHTAGNREYNGFYR